MRFTGVDAARGLAIVGMIAAHTIPRADRDLELLVDGRPSILFAVIAGVSLGLMTDARSASADRLRRRRARASLAIRAAALFVLGLVLWMLVTNIAVILDYYAVMFLLMIPLLFAPRWVLALVGAALLAAGPFLVSAVDGVPSFLVFSGIGLDDRLATLAANPLVPLVDVLFTGYYPALLWLPLLCAGLIAARSDLGATRTRWVMVAAGAMASLAGYGSGALLPGVTAEAHSVTPAELLGSGGLAIALIGLALLVLDPPQPSAVTRAVALVARPLAAIGSMPLTVYTGHILVIAALAALWGLGPAAAYSPAEGWWVLAGLIVLAAVGALLAQQFGRRGPLEAAISALSTRRTVRD